LFLVSVYLFIRFNLGFFIQFSTLPTTATLQVARNSLGEKGLQRFSDATLDFGSSPSDPATAVELARCFGQFAFVFVRLCACVLMCMREWSRRRRKQEKKGKREEKKMKLVESKTYL